MALTAIEDEKEIRRAYRRIEDRLTKATVPFDCIIGYPGGHRSARIRWNNQLGFWASFIGGQTSPRSGAKRIMLWVGTGRPQNSGNLDITCELNVPLGGRNLRYACVLARDVKGDVYICHSGKIGGGTKGVGKTAFLEDVGIDELHDVRWHDGVIRPLLLVGGVENPNFPSQLRAFLERVDEFKLAARSGRPSIKKKPDPGRFRPEFAGTRHTYQLECEISSEVNHGFVVNELHRQLEACGHKVSNDTPRDAYIKERNRVVVLYEVKAGTSTGHIYAAVGQLYFHAEAGFGDPVKVLVVPNTPKAHTKKILKRLGIEVVLYKLSKGSVRFTGLEKLRW